MFRELVAAQKKVLDPDDFQIGRALSGLATTLEKAGNLKEAHEVARKSLDHRHQHQGPDDFFTNHSRFVLARILQKLGLSAEAGQLLNAAQASIQKTQELDEEDEQLLAQINELQAQIIRSSGPAME